MSNDWSLERDDGEQSDDIPEVRSMGIGLKD
jgi:hypothetical protein